MREILDGVEPEPLRALLPQLCEKVRRAGWGGQFTTPLPSGQHQGTYINSTQTDPTQMIPYLRNSSLSPAAPRQLTADTRLAPSRGR